MKNHKPTAPLSQASCSWWTAPDRCDPTIGSHDAMRGSNESLRREPPAFCIWSSAPIPSVFLQNHGVATIASVGPTHCRLSRTPLAGVWSHVSISLSAQIPPSEEEKLRWWWRVRQRCASFRWENLSRSPSEDCQGQWRGSNTKRVEDTYASAFSFFSDALPPYRSTWFLLWWDPPSLSWAPWWHSSDCKFASRHALTFPSHGILGKAQLHWHPLCLWKTIEKRGN